MKKLPISPGLWMIYCGIIYLIVGMLVVYNRWWDPELTTVAYCLILSLPLWVKPIARWVGVETVFESIKGK